MKNEGINVLSLIRRYKMLEAGCVEYHSSAGIHPSVEHRHVFTREACGKYGGALCGRQSIKVWSYYDEPVDEVSGADALSHRV